MGGPCSVRSIQIRIMDPATATGDRLDQLRAVVVLDMLWPNAEAEISLKILSLSGALVAAPWGLSVQPALAPGALYKQTSPAVVVIEALGNHGRVARV